MYKRQEKYNATCPYIKNEDTIKSISYENKLNHINRNKIRLHAIDAPETNQTCKKNSKVWNCGMESTKFLKELIGNNKIECITKGKDRYNRFIGICYKDNLDLNSEMVLNGWAIAYRYYSKDYVEEEEEAKQEKKGIWIGDFEEPYLFRKKNK